MVKRKQQLLLDDRVEKFMDGLENLARLCLDYIKLDCRMSVSKATVFLCLCSHSHPSVLSVQLVVFVN